MASGLKVRLDDGSEVGPLEMAMVRSWYEQGLIYSDSAVQRAGSKSWTKLSQAVDLRAWGNLAVSSSKKKAVRSHAQSAAGARGKAQSDAAPTGGGLSFSEDWATRVGGVLLLVAAAGAGYLHLHPEDAVSPLDRAPFWAMALGLLASALALLPGWEWSRKVVRLLAVVAAAAAFPLLGILVAQGVRGKALLAVVGVLLAFGSLFAFLADPQPPWARAAISILAVLGTGAAAGYFTYAPETDAQRQVREAVTAEQRFGDPTIGITLDLPDGWRVLKKDATVLDPPDDAKVAFAHPRQEAFGYLTSASSPAGIATLDAWLDQVLRERRKAQPDPKEEGRDEVAVGTLTGRRANVAWTAAGVPYRETATVWRDGWIYYALVAWAPQSAGATDLEALTAGVVTSGKLAANLQTAVQKVTLEVPALTAAAAELLMARSEAKVLEPDQAFRRSFEAVANALPTWKPGEAQEMGRLIAACYATLSSRERTRLAAYVDKVQKHQMTSPQEDREMSQLMKAAVLRLPEAKRTRLQALYQRAVEAAVAAS
jgi:hypothetical protein